MTANKLHLFLVSGKTFTFRGADITEDNEAVLCFTYDAVSDGFRKRMTVYKSQLVGYSITT